MSPTLTESIALGFAACFMLGALVTWAAVQRWARPKWESDAWYQTAPAATRETIGRHARAAADFEDHVVTDLLARVPRIPPHDPPGLPAPLVPAAGWYRAVWLRRLRAISAQFPSRKKETSDDRFDAPV